MEIYKVDVHIQCEYRKIQTRKNSVFRHFSHSECSDSMSSAIPFSFLVRFNFVKLLFFYSAHSSHCSRFFKVAFNFTIVFKLFCLLNEKGKVLKYFELGIVPAERRIVYLMN